MVSGRSVHGEIRSKIREIEREHERFSAQVYDCEKRIDRLVDEREQCYIQLAEFYLPEMDAKSVKRTIKEVQGAVQRVYEEKQSSRKRLEESIERTREDTRELEDKLDEVTTELNQKAAERDEVQEKIAKELKENGHYQHLFAEASIAKEKMSQNNRRVKEIEQEAEEKLPAYKKSSLFMYLLNRKFDTPDYQHNGLVKRLDGWVAGIVNYKQAKKGYDFLRTMPELMRLEVQEREKELKELAKKVEHTEKDAAEKYGLQKVLDEGTKIGKSRDRLLEDIERYNSRYQDYTQQLEKLESTRGSFYQEAIGKLKSYLKGDDIYSLKQRALETRARKDDNLVERIEEIDVEIKNHRAEARKIKKEQREVHEKVNALHDIDRKYTRKDYESDRSYFGSGFDISSLLAGYLIGKYTEDSLWSEIESSQKFKPKPRPVFRPTRRRSMFDDDDDDDDDDFFSTSTRRRRSSSSSSSSSSGWGFGGGGFSSGGGFGGGGFSSGSGF